MTSSEDGTVKIWDWSEGRLIRTITMYGVPCRVRQMCIGEVAGKWWIFATITHERTGRNKTSKQRMKMNKKKDMGSGSDFSPVERMLMVIKLSKTIIGL